MVGKHIVLHELVLWSNREKVAAVVELMCWTDIYLAASLSVKGTQIDIQLYPISVRVEHP